MGSLAGLPDAPLSDRARLMREIAAGLEALGDGIIEVAMRETNLPEARLKGERARTAFQLRSYADACERGDWLELRIDTADLQRIPPKADIRKMMVPMGPVLVYGASNFPFAYSTAGGDTACALAAGCTVVVKAHPAHPDTSDAVAACIRKALTACGFPEDIFLHVHTQSLEEGRALVIHPRTRAVGFTGSHLAGRSIFNWANERKDPIPVFAEMGSANPVIIHNDLSKFEQVDYATKLAFSITNDAGQFCTKPGIIFIPNGEAGQGFLDELKHAISSVKPVPMLHPVILQNFESRRNQILSIDGVQAYLSETETKGIEGKWCLAETTLKNFTTHQTMQEEVFGPFALVVRYERANELNECLRLFSGQLTGSIFYHNLDPIVEEWIELLSAKVGRIVLNGVPTGVRVVETMHHGGPYPASSDVRFTAVGQDSIQRFQKDVTIQVQNIT